MKLKWHENFCMCNKNGVFVMWLRIGGLAKYSHGYLSNTDSKTKIQQFTFCVLRKILKLQPVNQLSWWLGNTKSLWFSQLCGNIYIMSNYFLDNKDLILRSLDFFFFLWLTNFNRFYKYMKTLHIKITWFITNLCNLCNLPYIFGKICSYALLFCLLRMDNFFC